MDNLAHTLAGAALGEAGLKEKTGLGLVALMLAANLPDVDAITILTGDMLIWRRGWTHGPVGLLLLPPLLAFALAGFDRWQARRGTRPAGRPLVRLRWLLLLAYLGALSHPLLDLLNTYGIRLLMPFSERWYYGDTLFIIDVWLWSILGLGVWLSRRRRRRGSDQPRLPAAAALAATCAYVGAMGAGSAHAEHATARAAEAAGLGRPQEVVASPAPLEPLRRRMILKLGDRYGFGEFRWSPEPRLRLDPGFVPTNMGDPAVAAAARADDALAGLLYWSRLPFARIERGPGGTLVTVGDARYADRPEEGRFARRVRLRAAEGEPAVDPTGPES